MTHDEAIKRLQSLSKGDPEDSHRVADGVLLRYLEHNGGEDIAKAWRDANKLIGFWYA